MEDADKRLGGGVENRRHATRCGPRWLGIGTLRLTSSDDRRWSSAQPAQMKEDEMSKYEVEIGYRMVGFDNYAGATFVIEASGTRAALKKALAMKVGDGWEVVSVVIIDKEDEA